MIANADGELEFILQFQSLETPYKVWAEPSRVKRYETFFGPGVKAEVYKVDSDQRILALKLTTVSKSASTSNQGSDFESSVVTSATPTSTASEQDSNSSDNFE
eukprot:gene1309-biopygen1401